MMPCLNKFPTPLIELEETDSTINFLGELYTKKQKVLEEFTTVTSEFQTSGKGQRGNSWEAEKGKNLLFSFILYPSFLEVKQQFLLSQLISLSIKEELDKWTKDISIKWPNDIYWKNRKICGILIENDIEGHTFSRCIAGIGLNINQEKFESNAPNPVSLKLIIGEEQNRHQILAHILKKVKQYYLSLRDNRRYMDTISQKYNNSLFRRNEIHPYKDVSGTFQARLVKVETDGRFILEDETGKQRTYLFKEVQYII